MTQKGWNAAAVLGVAAVLFNFALLKETQLRVIMIALGVFWTLFCLFRVARLLTGLTLGVSLSAFSFYGTTVVIDDPENASGAGFFFCTFACGIYVAVYFVKKLISYFKELRQQPDSTFQDLDFEAKAKPEIPASATPPQNPRLVFDTYYHDELLPAAVDVVLETGQASALILQRRLKLGYSRTSRLIDQMEYMGYVGPFEGSHPRQLLITKEQWAQMRGHIRYSPPKPVISAEQIVRDEEIWRQEKSGLAPIEYELRKVDGMDGHTFEGWCANLLRRNGFYSVKVTPGSGDQGVDITATKGGLTYAVQCKRYASDLGNTPIQEVVAGKAFYHCNVAAVMTNQHFTSGAKELAKVNGVLLWDRDKITDMLKTANTAQNSV